MEGIEQSVKDYLLNVASILIEDIGEKIFENLKKHILEDMYQPYNIVYLPSRNAQPSMEFLNAFELTNLKRIANYMSKEIVYNWQQMHTWSEPYYYRDKEGHIKSGNAPAHQDVWGNDVREDLFNILRERNELGCMPNRPVSHYENFWANFLEDIKNNLKKWIKQSLASYGITNVIINIDLTELGGDE